MGIHDGHRDRLRDRFREHGLDSFNDVKLKSFALSEGKILYTKPLNRQAGLFFDQTQCNTFQTESDDRIVTIFQKVLRAAIKYFTNQTFAPSELGKGDNLIVFPFPYTKRHEAYRVVLDKNTFRKGKTLNFLSAYYGGIMEQNASFDYTLLNSFYEEFKKVNIIETEDFSINEETPISSLEVQSLERPDMLMQPYLNYEDWQKILTKPQRDFIMSALGGAKRIEGAAGTGKTLAMILKCIHHLKDSNFEKRFIFITHSKANKEHITELFCSICPEITDYLCTDENMQGNLLVTTVQEWCINYLGTGLAETEYLDADAMESKEIQRLYIEQAFDAVKKKYYADYSKVMSAKMLNFINETDEDLLYDMLQYEIGVVIKGWAEGDLDVYKTLERPLYGVPCEEDVDFNYMHLIYADYQRQLEAEGRFDSDDIVLTAMSSLNAPIWRRRREIEGFDACFIDEKQLFNFNEESVFQYLNKSAEKNNIIFAIDKSQYAGEIVNKSADLVAMSMRDGGQYMDVTSSTSLSTSFRSTIDIVNLAFNIMSNGAMLFDNFDNPLNNISTPLTTAEEEKAFKPKYYLMSDDEQVISKTFELYDEITRKHKVSREKILIIVCTPELCNQMKKYLDNSHKQYEQILSRGDSRAVKKAHVGNKYLLAGIDYVGGLEFEYVIIAGVDEKRVPPKYEKNSQNYHFSNYAWHRRLYIAISRAKYGVIVIGNENFGSSPVFDNAVENGYIEKAK